MIIFERKVLMNDCAEPDFFRDSGLVENPYPYYETLRQR